MQSSLLPCKDLKERRQDGDLHVVPFLKAWYFLNKANNKSNYDAYARIKHNDECVKDMLTQDYWRYVGGTIELVWTPVLGVILAVSLLF